MLQALFLMEEHLAFAALLQVFHSKQNMVPSNRRQFQKKPVRRGDQYS